ncbi:hypothetical protein T459_04150 [Capsicum annuum]|uniref:Uncharacterized protein n=1 Tax=Capsicum annuum TaxID=4072 RepID=A0A2G3A473_CAPAN|nr:hypothetical protein T459_04150 [Capsicum annuum]
MGEMVKDGIKTDRIMSFTILKATTQAIQKGLGSVRGKKYEKYTSAIVVGQLARERGPHHRYPQGHSIEDCRALKREIEKIIQDKLIMVQNIDSKESSSHADMQTSR